MFCKSSKEASDDVLYTRQFFKTNKLLLLGTGESGKTTIIKQMKILHINGFSDEERKEKIPHIKQNIHESIYDILYNMDKIVPPVQFQNEESKKYAEFILAIGPEMPCEFTEITYLTPYVVSSNHLKTSHDRKVRSNFGLYVSKMTCDKLDGTPISELPYAVGVCSPLKEYYDNIKLAWNDPGVKETFRRSNEYQLIDCAEHFLNRLDDIRQADYIPSTQDILFCRIMTVSISKIEFEVPVPKKFGGGVAEFCVFDVGGQRGQRKKWIQVFEGIQAILFLIAASDFDQTLREDKNVNRLKEAFTLFEEIYTNRFLRDSGLIVFLNKQDLLQRKIEEGREFKKYFPEYANYRPKESNVTNEYDKVKHFMKQKILDIANIPLTVERIGFVPGKNVYEKLPPRDVFIHFTIATDTNNIKKVFDSVQEVILKNLIAVALY